MADTTTYPRACCANCKKMKDRVTAWMCDYAPPSNDNGDAPEKDSELFDTVAELTLTVGTLSDTIASIQESLASLTEKVEALTA